MRTLLTAIGCVLLVGCGGLADPATDTSGTESTESTQILRGVDVAGALSPGQARMLRDSYGVRWTGVYIGGNCDGGSGWDHSVVRAIHDATGWQFMPIYVGQQSPHICWASDLTYSRGRADGFDAADRMKAFDWRPDRNIPVALDLEAGTYEYSPGASTEYVRGWLEAVHQSGYRAYVYSSPWAINSYASSHLPIDGVWVASYFYGGFANVSPYTLQQIGNNFSRHDRAWQYAGDVGIAGIGGVDCDVSDLVLAPAPGGSNVGPSGPPEEWAPSSTVARNRAGGLEVFVRGTDGKLYHDWQSSTGKDGWHGWASLGGDITDTPAVGVNGDGRLEVFARGKDGSLVHVWQNPSGSWASWASFGGEITDSPSVVTRPDGHLEVFARGTNGHLYHLWEQVGAGWSGFASLDGKIEGRPAAIVDADGHLQVFARGSDQATWTIGETGANGAWGHWTSLGGATTDPPSVALNLESQPEVFVRGTNGKLYHTWRTKTGWFGFRSLDGEFGGIPEVGKNSDGRLEVFVRGKDDAVHHIWQHGDGSWTGWASLGGILTDTPRVAANQDGRLELFVRGADSALYHGWQVKGGWDCWTRLGADVANP